MSRSYSYLKLEAPNRTIDHGMRVSVGPGSQAVVGTGLAHRDAFLPLPLCFSHVKSLDNMEQNNS